MNLHFFGKHSTSFLICFLLLVAAGHSQTIPDSTDNSPKDKKKIGIRDSNAVNQVDARTVAQDSILRITSDSSSHTISKDSLRKLRRAERRAMENHNPNQALLRSLLLPGLGQIYNRKYWKLPIVYGGLGGLTYGVVKYHIDYKSYQKGFICREHPDSTICPASDAFSDISDSNLKRLRDQNRRMRDLFIIFTALGYTLTALDAYVDAHLMHFNVSDDLSMEFRPEIMYSAANQKIYPGLTINFHLRR